MAKTQLTTQLDPDVIEKLKRYAAAHHWSLSTAIRVLVEKGLEDA
jgi:hypothetical protein